MTPLERLLQEEIPVRPTPAPDRGPWTPEQQAAHRADLLNALDGWHWDRPTRPHLHLVDPATGSHPDTHTTHEEKRPA
ncbi:hypothetical protein [Streptomyces sp. NPDC001422]|uniref:hypothetical protein n=1 Tax=Streptomyces sp. NPDC001422 TaxID=3364575 RepID=UPI0036BCBFFF